MNKIDSENFQTCEIWVAWLSWNWQIELILHRHEYYQFPALDRVGISDQEELDKAVMYAATAS